MTFSFDLATRRIWIGRGFSTGILAAGEGSTLVIIREAVLRAKHDNKVSFVLTRALLIDAYLGDVSVGHLGLSLWWEWRSYQPAASGGDTSGISGRNQRTSEGRAIKVIRTVIWRVFATLRQRSRRRRYLRMRDLVEIESLAGFILDLGSGPASFFAAMFPRPKQVILADVDYKLAHQAKQRQSALNVIVADGERLPLADGFVDMTVCNSVIEHVDAPDALAAEIRRVSHGYFLQTPRGDFPFETHSFIAIPFYNLIRWVWLRRLICEIFRADFEYVSSVRYLPEQRLRFLFPEATITYEKVLGLKKSFYVYYLNENVQ